MFKPQLVTDVGAKVHRRRIGQDTLSQVLKLDPSNKAAKSKIRNLLKLWFSNGALAIVEGEDEKRMKRKFVEVGQRADD